MRSLLRLEAAGRPEFGGGAEACPPSRKVSVHPESLAGARRRENPAFGPALGAAHIGWGDRLGVRRAALSHRLLEVGSEPPDRIDGIVPHGWGDVVLAEASELVSVD